jgi:Flp pilus assembly protein TadG
MTQRNGKRPFFSDGVVMIEYAILLPALLLFVLGIMDVGRLIWTQTTLDRAVEAAARCGAIDTNNCGTLTKIENYAVTQAFGLVISSSAFTASTASCGIQVVASFPFVFVTPYIKSSTLTLAATACYPT